MLKQIKMYGAVIAVTLAFLTVGYYAFYDSWAEYACDKHAARWPGACAGVETP